MPACLSVLLMNKTSTNSLVFYFDKAKQKKCVLRLHEKNIAKYFVLLSRNNPLMLKGLKSVNNLSLPAKMEKIYGMHKLVGLQLFEWDSHFFQWDSYFLPDGSPELLFSKS